MDLAAAGHGIDVAGELKVQAAAAEALPQPLVVAVQHRVGQVGAVQGLLDLVDRRVVGHGGVGDGGKRVGVAAEPEVVVHGAAAGAGPHIAAGLAHALHGQQGDDETGKVGTAGGAAHAAEAAPHARASHGAGGGPAAGDGLDVGGLHAGDLLGPGGRLGGGVGAQAQDVVLPLVEAVAMLGDVLLVIGALGDPHIGDGFTQGRISAHPGGDPLVRLLDRGEVIEGVDVDELHPRLLHPPAPQGGLLGGVAAPGGVRVVGPHNHGLGVFHGVVEHIEGLGPAQAPVIAVGMGGAPVEALPGVGVVHDAGVAQHGEKALKQGDFVAAQAPGVVGAGDGGDRLLAVGALDTLNLPGH